MSAPKERDEFTDLPGAELVLRGVADAVAGRESIEACLALLARQRLSESGLPFAADASLEAEADYRLYHLLARDYGDEAHARYNALLRELVSFERALERRQGQRQVPELPS